MQPHMLIRTVELSVLWLGPLSLDIGALRVIDDRAKYREAGDMELPEGDTERRRARAPRGPSPKTMVRYACDDAEELGRKLREELERLARCQGTTTGGSQNGRRAAR